MTIPSINTLNARPAMTQQTQEKPSSSTSSSTEQKTSSVSEKVIYARESGIPLEERTFKDLSSSSNEVSKPQMMNAAIQTIDADTSVPPEAVSKEEATSPISFQEALSGLQEDFDIASNIQNEFHTAMNKMPVHKLIALIAAKVLLDFFTSDKCKELFLKFMTGNRAA